MQGGEKPRFLENYVAYYVMFADKWRYAASLAAVTKEERALHLGSRVNATDVLNSGSLSTDAQKGDPDHYIYDPRDVSSAELESHLDPASLVDQTLVYARSGKQLVYHSAAFDADTEVSGFFRLSAWIAIDQPDTAFRADVYEIRPDGSSIVLTSQFLQARYRQSVREPQLVTTKAPQKYDFDHFSFVSQQIKKGSRLRLVIAPVNSYLFEKNYNSGGVVAEESMKDARPVNVKLYHDPTHQSTLYVPLGH
jgi:putative CocE/NonD family hydrolase